MYRCKVVKYLSGLLNCILFILIPESKLTTGNKCILSSRGIQQYDPIGPLLFSLSLKILTGTIINILSNLNISLFYLDVCIIV